MISSATRIETDTSFWTRDAGAFLLSLLVPVLLHFSSFSLPHNEGDEVVYLSLAERMTWLFENYSTQDVPGVNQFHLKLYRAPLFIHPPLFPYLLKILSIFGDPVALGLWLNIFVHSGIVLVSRAMGRAAGLTGGYLDCATLLVLFCPVLFMTTHTLHMDAFFTLGLMGTALLLLKATTANAERFFSLAGITAGITMNIKVNGPLVFLLPLPAMWMISKNKKDLRSIFNLFGYFAFPALVLGLPHYLHLWFQYGFTGVRDLFVDELPLTPYVKFIRGRNWAQLLIHILLLSPFTFPLLMASYWKSGIRWIRAQEKAGVLFGIWVIFFAAGMMRFRAEKYWVIFLPVTTVTVLLLLQTQGTLKSTGGRLVLGTFGFLTIAATAAKAATSPSSVIVMPFLSYINQAISSFLWRS